jgi:hypothetical protein
VADCAFARSRCVSIMGAYMTDNDKKLFSDEQPGDVLLRHEVQQVEAEVRKEIEREKKALAKEILRKQLREQIEREEGLVEPLEPVTIDLPDYANDIKLDNRLYLQGMTYEVTHSVAETLRDIMQRTWEHKSIIDGKSENYYRRSRDGGNIRTPNGVVNTRQMLRA